MAITKGAKKAIRNAEKKRVFNVRRTRAYRAIVKEVQELVVGGKAEEAQAKLPLAYKAIDKAAKMGTIKKGTADRKKSRLSTMIKKSKEVK